MPEVKGTAAVRVYVNEANGTVHVSTATPNSGGLKFAAGEWDEFTGDIARAAQVRILRETAEKIRQSSWTSRDEAGAVVARSIALHIAQVIDAKVAELESGGGQTGAEVQGDDE
jgi:hypothetical protein